MKIVREAVEVSDEGLEGLMGKTVTIFCSAYIYTGVLIGVNQTCVKLSKVSIVYDTGDFTDKKWADAQPLPEDWYVQTSSIESFGILK